jgi:hypothetical protein
MQGKDVVDKFGQYQRGEIKAEDVVQSVAGLGTATVGMKTANRMDRSLSTKPELHVEQQPDVGLSNRGYRPQPGERTMTREEYKIQSSAARNFPGKQTEMNCAPQSCQQIIRASNGRTLSEAEMATSAKTSANYNPKTGTLASRVPDVLRAEGVKATTMPNKPERIQSALAEGKGVSSMHDAGKLWGNDAKGGHAVHVTSVVKDSKGKVTHYVINDTGTGQAGRRVTAEQYEGSLLKAPATVTEQPISHGGRTASEARRKAAKAKKGEGGIPPTGKDKSSDSGTTNDLSEAKSRTGRDVDNDVSLGAKQSGNHESEISQKRSQEPNLESKVTSEHDNEIQFSGKKQSWTTDLTPYTGKRVKARNKAIRAVIKDNLPDLNLRYIPEFSPNATTGMARTYEPGRGTQLGHKSFEDRNTLIDVIVHEDLHHRWRDRGVEGDHHFRRGAPYPDSLRYKDMKFYATVARYMRMRGFKHNEDHTNQWSEYVKANKVDRAKIVRNYDAHMTELPEDRK